VGRAVELLLPGEYRRGDNRHSVSSITKLRALGWRPSRGLSTILEDFMDWVARSGGIPEELADAYSDMKQSGVVLAAVH
jgi:dTDP-L-rhamnose 4-epimerase